MNCFYFVVAIFSYFVRFSVNKIRCVFIWSKKECRLCAFGASYVGSIVKRASTEKNICRFVCSQVASDFFFVVLCQHNNCQELTPRNQRRQRTNTKESFSRRASGLGQQHIPESTCFVFFVFFILFVKYREMKQIHT